jgi:uncharacterized protein YbjT (DUF2867 family)
MGNAMKLLVIGATGGTGRLLLTEGVARGHAVTAFARRPDALTDVPGLAGVVGGNARDADALTGALAGQDAVITTVGPRGRTTDPTVVADSTRALIQAARTAGVRRVVKVSAYGIVATRPRVLLPLARRLLGGVFADQAVGDDLLAASGLDWTVVRPPRLTNGRPRGRVRVSTRPFETGPYTMSRADLARYLLDVVDDPASVGVAVNVTG